jgi:succinate dehydrogenase / fumarate reductase cytochrome b subunit
MAGQANQLTAILDSSIGKKVLMSLTGLFLCFFLLNHLYTNLLLYKPLFNGADGGASFNEASHALVTSILVRMVEIVLFASIILHVVQAIRLTVANKKARPIGYESGSKAKAGWISKNMGLTGSVILFFLIVHLYNFFLPYRITGEVGGDSGITLAKQVTLALANPFYSGIYLVGTFLLGLHLSHGFQSAFQTLGLNNNKYESLIKSAGYVYAVLVTVGFMSFPVMFYFNILGCADKIQ